MFVYLVHQFVFTFVTMVSLNTILGWPMHTHNLTIFELLEIVLKHFYCHHGNHPSLLLAHTTAYVVHSLILTEDTEFYAIITSQSCFDLWGDPLSVEHPISLLAVEEAVASQDGEEEKSEKGMEWDTISKELLPLSGHGHEVRCECGRWGVWWIVEGVCKCGNRDVAKEQ